MHKYAEIIDRERIKRNWTFYKLADESGVSQGTIHQWFHRNSIPTLQAIEKICSAYGITLGEFFTQGDFVELTADKKELFDKWTGLTKAERQAVMGVINSYADKKGI